MKSKSDLERAFLFHLRAFAPNLSLPESEYRFSPPRRWRFDFAWIDEKIAIELEGGTFWVKCRKCNGKGNMCKSCSGKGKVRGRHTSGKGYEADCEKYNKAAIDNWLLLRFTSRQLSHDPKSAIDMVMLAIDMRRGYDVERCPNCGEALKIMKEIK